MDAVNVQSGYLTTGGLIKHSLFVSPIFHSNFLLIRKIRKLSIECSNSRPEKHIMAKEEKFVFLRDG